MIYNLYVAFILRLTLRTSWDSFPAPTHITSGPAIVTSDFKRLDSATWAEKYWIIISKIMGDIEQILHYIINV